MRNKLNCELSKKAMAFAAVCLILSTPTILLGWGAGGHMMVAHIAFGRLNPNAKAQVQKLLAVLKNRPPGNAERTASPHF